MHLLYFSVIGSETLPQPYLRWLGTSNICACSLPIPKHRLMTQCAVSPVRFTFVLPFRCSFHIFSLDGHARQFLPIFFGRMSIENAVLLSGILFFPFSSFLCFEFNEKSWQQCFSHRWLFEFCFWYFRVMLAYWCFQCFSPKKREMSEVECRALGSEIKIKTSRTDPTPPQFVNFFQEITQATWKFTV